MAVSTREMLIILHAQGAAQATGEVNKVNSAIQATGLAGNKASMRLFGYSNAFEQVGRSVRRAGILLTAASIGSGKLASNFDRDMRLVQTQAGLTRKEFNTLGQATLDMSVKTGRSTKELSEGLFDIFSGTTANAAEATEMIELFAQAAVAGATDIRTVSKGAIFMMNSFGLSARDTSRILDLQFGLVKRGIGTYEDFAKSFGKLTSSAVAAGQSIETMSSSLAFTTRQGLPAAEATTALARAFDLISKPGIGTRIRENLGVDIIDRATNQFKQMDEIITEMATTGGLAEMSKPEMKNTFKDIFGQGEIRAMRFFNIAIPQFESLNRIVKDVSGAGSVGAMLDAFEEMAQSGEFAFDQLKAAATGIAIEFGSSMIPLVKELAEGMMGLFDRFRNLDDSTKTLIGRWVFFAGIVGILSGTVMLLVGRVLRLISIFKLAGVAIGGVAGAVGLFIAATAILVGWLAKMKGEGGGVVSTLGDMALKAGLAIGAFVLLVGGAKKLRIGLAALRKTYVELRLSQALFGGGLRGLISAIGPMKIGIGVAIGAFMLWQNELQKTKQKVESFHRALEGGRSSFQKQAADLLEQEGLLKKFEEAGISTEEVIHNMWAATEGSPVAANNLRRFAEVGGEKFSLLVATLAEGKERLDRATAATGDMKDEMDSAGGVLSEVDGISQDLGDAIDGVNEAMRDATDEATGLSEAMDSLGEVQINVEKASIAWRGSLRRLLRTVKENGTALLGTSESADAVKEAFLDALERAKGLAAGVEENTGSAKRGARVLKEHVKELIQQGKQAGISEEEIRKLLTRLDLTPKSIQAVIDQHKKADRAAKGQAESMRDIPGRVDSKVMVDTTDAIRKINELLRDVGKKGLRIATPKASDAKFFSKMEGHKGGRVPFDLMPHSGALKNDETMAVLKRNEYVVNPKATRRNLAALEAINSGSVMRLGDLPDYHNGGLVDGDNHLAQRFRAYGETLKAMQFVAKLAPPNLEWKIPPGVGIAGATPAAARYAGAAKSLFPAITGVGIKSIRKIQGTNTWSQHAYGNAVDLMVGGDARYNASAGRLGDAISAWTRTNWSELKVRNLLWRTLTGGNHYNHTHTDFHPKMTGSPMDNGGMFRLQGPGNYGFSIGRNMVEDVMFMPKNRRVSGSRAESDGTKEIHIHVEGAQSPDQARHLVNELDWYRRTRGF